MRFIDRELMLPQNMEQELNETIRKENEEMGKVNRSKRSLNVCP
jgi:hypothetical protein